MSTGSLLVVGSAVIALLSAVACTAPSVGNGATDSGKNSEVKKKTHGTTDNSCLGKAELEFASSDCTACMNESDGCCEATVACFKDDDDCTAMHSCMQACGGGGNTGPSDTTTTPPSGVTPPGTTPPPANTGAGRAQFASTVYPLLTTPQNGELACSNCHLNNSAPFMGPDANSTYDGFIAAGFNVAGSIITNKGRHAGPPMSAALKAAVVAWQGVEASASRSLNSRSNEDGAAQTAVTETDPCRAACQQQHPKSVSKYQAYNKCAWTTCASTCR